ncbi:signal peptidase I [Candidatus Enterococcus clewellii]|uniref:Signal peptidase I n=1 Tax=Candidatus Enterococcus clewellii TaxID=1834193 RepID=A0A242K6Z5_9ENTE|nr:signal peptidase I [Enterococcus sp. 9E7_DIV0242]OTP16080.1 signal peptidase I [Enterococcus sp. 9E7_DIV0242]
MKRNKLIKFRLKKRFPTKQKEFFISAFFFICIIGLLLLFFLKIRTHRIDGDSMKPTLHNGDRVAILKTDELKRYDLVTFIPEEEPNESYIKRIVGLPGDRIWVEGNALFINYQMGDSEPESNLPAKELPDGTLKVTITENVWNDVEHLEVIPADCYFVLGDNRTHSTDSRHLGLIKSEQIEGTVLFRYYPFSSIGNVN